MTGLPALIAVVLGVAGWEAEVIVLAVIAIVVIIVGAYALSRP